MVFWTAIKSKLKKIIPGSRAYLDKKLKAVENRLKDLSNKVKNCDNKLKTLNNKSYELEQINRRQEKFLQEIQQLSQSQIKMIEELKQYMGQEFQRRDNWGKRAEEIRRSADGRPVWVIKCPAPEGPERVQWGDHAYAVALKKYLDRLGIYTVLDAKEDWDCEENADVVLVLRGCHFYRPDRRNKKCIYIMWNISHPEMVNPEEYELYDIVGICSYRYAREVAEQVKVPVLPLLQCTDTEIFYPVQKEPETYENEYVFIGNSRGVARRCIVWASQDKLPLKIWGGGWSFILGSGRLYQKKGIAGRVPKGKPDY